MDLVMTTVDLIGKVCEWMDKKDELKENLGGFSMHLRAINLALNVVVKHPAAVESDNIKALIQTVNHAVREGSLLAEKVAIKSKSFWYSPSKYLDQIAETEKALDRIIPVLTLALVPYQSDAMKKTLNADQAKNAKSELLPSDLIHNDDALKFWEKYFQQSLKQPVQAVLDKLIEQYDLAATITDESVQALTIQLDESKDGMVTAYEFNLFVRNNHSLDEAINTLARGNATLTKDELNAVTQRTTKRASTEDLNQMADVNTKLNIIWVIARMYDDDRAIVEESKNKGYQVLTVPSPQAAVEYLSSPAAIPLLRGDHPFRLMTQNHDYHPDFDMVPNGHTAEVLVRFLRGRRCQAPVLIYCNYTLPTAEAFAAKYKNVWATNEFESAQKWITFGKINDIDKVGSFNDLAAAAAATKMNSRQAHEQKLRVAKAADARPDPDTNVTTHVDTATALQNVEDQETKTNSRMAKQAQLEQQKPTNSRMAKQAQLEQQKPTNSRMAKQAQLEQQQPTGNSRQKKQEQLLQNDPPTNSRQAKEQHLPNAVPESTPPKKQAAAAKPAKSSAPPTTSFQAKSPTSGDAKPARQQSWSPSAEVRGAKKQEPSGCCTIL